MRIRMLIPTVVLGAALIAATGCGGDDTTPATTGAATATTASGSITGSGSSFVYPLVSKWIPSLRDQALDVTYSPDGLGRRRRSDHGPDRRLRRLRRAALGGAVRGLQGVCPDPVGALGNLGRFQPRWDRHDQADRRAAGADLSRRGEGLGRPGDRRAQPRGRAPVHDRSRPVYRSDSSGTSYNFTDFLQRGEPRLEEPGRPRHECELAGRDGREGQLRRRRGRREDRGRAHLRRRRLRARERPRDRVGPERGGGKFVDNRSWQAIGKAAAAVDMASIPDNRRDLGRRAARVGEGRVPDLHLHVRDPGQGVRQGGAGEGARRVRARRRAGRWPDLLFRPLPEPVRTFGREQLALVG